MTPNSSLKALFHLVPSTHIEMTSLLSVLREAANALLNIVCGSQGFVENVEKHLLKASHLEEAILSLKER